jgi:hypothetical protein
MFGWTLTTSDVPVAHLAAIGTVENYRDALEIICMPILGTREDLGNDHTCAFWEWDMQDATVRHIDATFEFLRPFRLSGMNGRATLGMLNSGAKSAFQVLRVKWRLAFPPREFHFLRQLLPGPRLLLIRRAPPSWKLLCSWRVSICTKAPCSHSQRCGRRLRLWRDDRRFTAKPITRMRLV